MNDQVYSPGTCLLRNTDDPFSSLDTRVHMGIVFIELSTAV